MNESDIEIDDIEHFGDVENEDYDNSVNKMMNEDQSWSDSVNSEGDLKD